MTENHIEKPNIIAQIIKCCNFAAIKHKDQRRKSPDSIPYINHPIGKSKPLLNNKK